MSRYIDADKLKSHYAWWQNTDQEAFDCIVDEQPTADVRENVRGEWQITDAYPHNVHCSVCHEKVAQTHWQVWQDGSLPRNFCPNCGADMRGEA